MSQSLADELLGPGLEALLTHIETLPPGPALVGRRNPVLRSFVSTSDKEVANFDIPGGRPGVGLHCPLGFGEVLGLYWRLDGCADFERENEPRGVGPQAEPAAEAIVQMRASFPWASPEGLLPADFSTTLEDLSPERYWRARGAKPIAVYWLLTLCTNPTYPSRGASLTVKFTYAGLRDRLLQAIGYIWLVSPRRGYSPLGTRLVRKHAGFLRPRERAQFLLRYFREIRELPPDSQVVQMASAKEIAQLKRDPAGEPHADLPVIVLKASGVQDRRSLLAQLSLLLLQHSGMPDTLRSRAEGSLKGFLEGRRSRRQGARGRQEDIPQAAIDTLWQHYGGRASSARSFDAYVDKVLKNLTRRDGCRETRHRNHGGLRSAARAAEDSGLSRRSVRDLAKRRIVGRAHGEVRRHQTPGGLTVESRPSPVKFTDGDIEQLKTRARERDHREVVTALVKAVAKRRRTTTRAAQRLIQRRIKSGASFEEVGRELLAAGGDPLEISHEEG